MIQKQVISLLGVQIRKGNKINYSIWPKRLFALDASRGIASLSVVLWHWQHFAYNGSSLSRDFERTSQPLYAILKIFYQKGIIGVEYFFLLSGFIFFWRYMSSIRDKNTSFSNFWVLRISRLYPLHIVTLLLVALLQTVYTSHNGISFVYPNNDMYHFILNLGFASSWGFEKGSSFNAPVWSVSIEIFLYFLFFMIVYARQGQAWFCLGVSVIFFIIEELYTNNAILSGASLFFLGGFVFHSTCVAANVRQKLKIAIYIFTVLSWVLTIANFYVFDLCNFILEFGVIGKILLIGFPNYILFSFTVFSLALIEIDKEGFSKSISWLGDITYSTYLLHFPLQLAFALAVSYGVLDSVFYLSPTYFVGFFSILIPFSYITFIWFERPMQNIIRNKWCIGR